MSIVSARVLRLFLFTITILLVPIAVWAAEIRVGLSDGITTLDPGNHRGRLTETVLRNIHDGLLTRNAKMEVVPEIAESWKQLDPVTFQFQIRKGIQFHDGTPLTSEDIEFTFERLIREGAIAGQTSPRKSLLGSLMEVEAIDETTVLFKLAEPWPILPAMLPFQEVVSKKFVESIGDDALQRRANGAGPFKLVEWRQGRDIVMDRYDGYYGGAADIPPVGPARVERVAFLFIPDADARVAALLSGDVDIIDGVPTDEFHKIAKNPNVRLAVVNGTRTFFMGLDNKRPPFNDPRVRRAANFAVDIRAIIDDVLLGTATPLNGVLSPDAFGFNENLPAYEFNPGKARKLLIEAGYPDGVDVIMEAEFSSRHTAEAVAGYLSEVGIRTTVKATRQWSALFKDWTNPQGPATQMLLFNWGNASLDPVGIFVPLLRSGGRGNVAGYSNPEVDRLLDAADKELDRSERARLYQRAQEIVNADAPWIFLWLPKDVYGVSKRVKGWQPSPDGRINLHDSYIEE